MTSSTADRPASPSEKPSERRAREKRDKDPTRPHKSRSSKPRPIDPETGEPVRRRRREKEESLLSRSSMADVVPEMARTPGERETFPYPCLSKAHSKESVYSLVEGKPDSQKQNVNVYTPEPTDVGGTSRMGSRESLNAAAKRTDSRESLNATTQNKERPLTPPDTELSQQRKSSVSGASRTTKLREEGEKIAHPGSRSSERSWFGRPKIVRDDKSKVSTNSRESRASTARRSSKPKVDVLDDDYLSDETHSQSGLDSNATSVAPKRSQPLSATTVSGGRPPGLDTDSGQSNRESASPRTPTATQNKFDAPDPKQFARDFRPTPSPFVSFDSPSEAYDSPLPPPPPPPPTLPMSIPRVDYLMQHGGLSRPVPKHLLAVTPSYPGGRAASTTPGAPDIANVFGPFYGLLDQYETVIAKNGSVAVATGYRSIARKLLDRLENVFARELSADGCACALCAEDGGADTPTHSYGSRALGWGDVLEWVSGRRALPPWPAFDLASLGSTSTNVGLGISDSGRPASPQQIDPDIADEFREHYLRQSKKTKAAVDRWLSATPATSAAAAPPPADIDDETLTFTLLTHLPPSDRPLFSALLTGSAPAASSRAPTPLGAPRSEFITKTAAALQRLYRLAAPPRAPEAAVYLLRNPELHHLLATLALINASEWEILVSGRFDGFLWSGAESEDPQAAPLSRGPSRSASRASAFSPSPAYPPSRGPTPSSFQAPMSSAPGTPFPGHGRNPVSNDEETEIAVLAELEREIYAGMEALEDAFEALHRKAEGVRQGLRLRGAGLQMAAAARRSGGAGGDGAGLARMGTPAGEGWGGYESEGESEWAPEEGEIAPDDSASNVSSSRHRRPKRRNERRTPAPLEEEDEEE